jgi:branched-chain amino acid aminotransferase
LYLRPLVFASEGKMGVKIADEYLFVVMTAPVSILYAKPIKVKVERHYIRAAPGGTGSAKCAGNYGGAFYATQKAKEEGFDNLLWMDAVEHEYVEESGTMNLLFVLDGKLVTPPVSDTILNGVTRDSLLTLANDAGLPVEERRVSIDEIIAAVKGGKPVEAFGAGTAAVVAPIQVIGVDGELYQLPVAANSIVYSLKRRLEAIRLGKAADVHHWNFVVPA